MNLSVLAESCPGICQQKWNVRKRLFSELDNWRTESTRIWSLILSVKNNRQRRQLARKRLEPVPCTHWGWVILCACMVCTCSWGDTGLVKLKKGNMKREEWMKQDGWESQFFGKVYCYYYYCYYYLRSLLFSDNSWKCQI